MLPCFALQVNILILECFVLENKTETPWSHSVVLSEVFCHLLTFPAFLLIWCKSSKHWVLWADRIRPRSWCFWPVSTSWTRPARPATPARRTSGDPDQHLLWAETCRSYHLGSSDICQHVSHHSWSLKPQVNWFVQFSVCICVCWLTGLWVILRSLLWFRWAWWTWRPRQVRSHSWAELWSGSEALWVQYRGWLRVCERCINTHRKFFI